MTGFMHILQYLFQAPTTDWLRFGVFFVGIFIIIGLAERIRHSLGWPTEVTRKLIHILTGVLIFFTPYFFVSDRPLIWMAILFIVINSAGIKAGKLKGMHDTSRRSYGTVFYPITFLILVLTCWSGNKIILMLAMLILALSDAAAAIVGESLHHPHEYKLARDKKSIEGSVTMFLVTFLIVTLLLPVIDEIGGLTIGFQRAAWIGLVTASVATALEALSTGGSDNLTAPLGSAFIIAFMLGKPTVLVMQLTVGAGLALGVALFSIKSRFLSISGSVATFLLATVIFGIGGWSWAVPILVFFISSSLLSKIGKAHKAQYATLIEKSSQRDVSQVFANGGVAGVLVLLFHYFPDPIWYGLFLGSIAGVNADTWATEIGVFSKPGPRSITRGKPVPIGASGGVTLLGLVGATVGALIIPLSGWLVASDYFRLIINPTVIGIILAAGFLANIIDSLLGDIVQAQYQCSVCEKRTERKVHCKNQPTILVSGKPWLNNDLVNLFCASSGAILVWVGVQIFCG